MTALTTTSEASILIRRNPKMMSLILNRPRVLNSLNLEMIRILDGALDEVEAETHCQFVLLCGAGERGFCAGGDIKALAMGVKERGPDLAGDILEEEYDLCLRLHRFPKPIVVLADGITYGAGLGLAAGADLVIATERTRMAMPETRIGFFPDVGSTGWMFTRCPKGYPEYLGLTGYELGGAEAVRVGFATHLTESKSLNELISVLEGNPANLPQSRTAAAQQLIAELDRFFVDNIPSKPEMDDWVASYFSGKTSVVEMMESLRQCSIQAPQCEGVFYRLSERSPTAVVLTLKLLRHNEGKPMDEVFKTDLRAAQFMVSHPDYLEGVRARLLDKDDNPRWQPASIEEVGQLEVDL